jgi:hypothetical protein
VGVGLLNSFSLSLSNSHAPETNNGLQVPPPSNSYSRPPIPTKQTRCKGDTKQVLFHAAVIYRIAHHIGYSYPFGPSAKLGPAELIHGPGQQATHPTAQTYPLPLLTTHAMTQASLPPPLLASAPARALMSIDVPPARLSSHAAHLRLAVSDRHRHGPIFPCRSPVLIHVSLPPRTWPVSISMGGWRRPRRICKGPCRGRPFRLDGVW